MRPMMTSLRAHVSASNGILSAASGEMPFGE